MEKEETERQYVDVGDWNWPPKDTSLWHEDYFGLVTFKNCRWEGGSGVEVLTFC